MKNLELHPLAWWLWAIGIAAAATTTTNPLLLIGIIMVLTVVVLQRRGDSVWSRTFFWYFGLLGWILVIRLLLYFLVGLKFGDTLLFALPSLQLPTWAAGINLGGQIYLEGLLLTLCAALRLGVMILAMGAANSLANPRKLLRSLPQALQELGTAVVVAVNVAPQLARSAVRVKQARTLRGEMRTGLLGFGKTALPVLQDTLDRSLQLAAAMESRGYGAIRTPPTKSGSGLTFLGLTAATIGIYGVMTQSVTNFWLGWPLLIIGLAVGAIGIFLVGRSHPVSNYFPNRFGTTEIFTACCGAICYIAFYLAGNFDPLVMQQPVSPVRFPDYPLLPVLGLVIAVLPAWFPTQLAQRAVK